MRRAIMARSTSRSRSLRGRTGHTIFEKTAESSYALQTEVSAPLHVSDEPKSCDLRSTKPLKTFKPMVQPLGDISNRPRTSGSPKTSAWNIEKQARDDIQFNPLRANRVSVISAYYNFPLPAFPMPKSLPSASTRRPVVPARTPTPEPTPYASPASSPTVADAPEHVANPKPLQLDLIAMHAEAMGIGMALGSPNHQPLTQPSDQQLYIDDTPVSTPEEDHHTVANENVPTKQKHSRWKLLGGLFGKKSADAPAAFYQLQHTDPDYREPNHSYSAEPQKSSRSLPTRGKTESEPRRSPRKPHLKRAHTTQVYGDLEKESTTDESQRTPPAIRLDVGPMLDVDIPSIHMERYSIMFGSVLKQPSSDQSSSLLARRQATLDRLKTVNEAIAEIVCLAGVIRRCAYIDGV